MTRNTKGWIGWLLAAILSGLIAEIAMILREVYQSHRYGFRIEVNDLWRYSAAIAVGCSIHFVLLWLLFF